MARTTTGGEASGLDAWRGRAVLCAEEKVDMDEGAVVAVVAESIDMERAGECCSAVAIVCWSCWWWLLGGGCSGEPNGRGDKSGVFRRNARAQRDRGLCVRRVP